MQRREQIALQKICSEIDLTLKFIGDEKLEEFLADELVKHAVGMTAINIGELTKHLSAELRQQYPEIAWKKATAFRDVVAHKYETLNMKDVYKTVREDFPELHVVAAGSLLEFTLQELPSFGVGRIHSLFVYPFSFDEFLAAEGKAEWVKAKQESGTEKPLLTPLYNDIVQHFRTFLMVGGMPASVEAWVSTHDYTQCQAELDDIQLAYYDDFPKYAKKVDPTLLRNTLQSVVMQIGEKFTFSHVEGGYRAEEVKKALKLLCLWLWRMG